MPGKPPRGNRNRPKGRPTSKPDRRGVAKKKVRRKVDPTAIIAPPAAAEAHANESDEARRIRTGAILKLLHQHYGDAECALVHRNAYELLAATILSAQCTDERVNKVTPALFKKYPDVAAMAAAETADVEALIHTCGFYRNKAKNLVGMSRRVVEAFGGRIPNTMEQLLTLPGVARKTANCVLGTWFEKNEGIVVDTHVGRLAHRLGLTTTARNTKDAETIERDLMPLVPRADWTYVSHALIEHGREICQALRPRCGQCVLAPLCPSAGLFEPAAGAKSAGVDGNVRSKSRSASKRPMRSGR